MLEFILGFLKVHFLMKTTMKNVAQRKLSCSGENYAICNENNQ